jgi:hypothetical protein
MSDYAQLDDQYNEVAIDNEINVHDIPRNIYLDLINLGPNPIPGPKSNFHQCVAECLAGNIERRENMTCSQTCQTVHNNNNGVSYNQYLNNGNVPYYEHHNKNYYKKYYTNSCNCNKKR